MKIKEYNTTTKFRDIRLKNRLSVRELIIKFDLAGYLINRGMIHNYESGEQQGYSLYVLEAYMKVFKVSADYLLGFGG